MRIHRVCLAAFLGVGLWACAIPVKGPLGSMSNKPPAFYSLMSLPGVVYQQDFTGTPIGSLPADWTNQTRIGPAFPWLIPGAWTVALSGRVHVLEQTGIAWPWYLGAPPLAFMRFNAATFHLPLNGLPDRYVADIGLKVAGCDPRDPYFPIGDTGVQVYFRDPTHYCEVVYRPHTVEMWQCNGGEPFRFPGWTLLGRFTNQSFAGQPLTVHVQVDTGIHALTAWLPGQARPVTVHSLVIQPGVHWLALRASNSVVQYDHVTIQAL